MNDEANRDPSDDVTEPSAAGDEATPPQTAATNWKRYLIIACVLLVAAIATVMWNAMKSPRQVINLNPQTEVRLAHYQMLSNAKATENRGEHEKALAEFHKVMELEAGSNFGWDATIWAACVKGRMGEFEHSISTLEKIIEECTFKDQVPMARTFKAEIHSLAGDHDIAERQLLELIEDYADRIPRVCARALWELCAVYKRQDRFALSRAALIRVADEFPGTEDSFKKPALANVELLTKSLAKEQTPIIEKMIADENVKRIEGPIEGEAVWSAGDGPYLITENIVISPGAQVRIEAGTVIHCALAGAIEVKGALQVEGTEDHPVKFLTLRDSPDMEWWLGLTIPASPDSPTLNLKHCWLESAAIAVRADAGQIDMEHCIIDRCGKALLASRDSKIRMVKCRISSPGSIPISCRARPELHLVDCHIQDVKMDGVFLQDVDSKSTISGTTIESCFGNAILLRGESKALIERCTLQDNRLYGVRSMDGALPTVMNSTIKNNSAGGILLQQRWDGVVSGNTILGNGGNGVQVDTRCRGRFEDNLIQDNGGAGLNFRLACEPSITGNRFVGNKDTGLLFVSDSLPKVLRNNQFAGNEQSALRNESSSAVNAADNWWGSTDPQEIAEMIHDQSDDANWGEVIFEPFLTTPPESAATQAQSAAI